LSEIYIVREFILSSLYYDKNSMWGCSIWYIKENSCYNRCGGFGWYSDYCFGGGI